MAPYGSGACTGPTVNLLLGNRGAPARHPGRTGSRVTARPPPNIFTPIMTLNPPRPQGVAPVPIQSSPPVVHVTLPKDKPDVPPTRKQPPRINTTYPELDHMEYPHDQPPGIGVAYATAKMGFVVCRRPPYHQCGAARWGNRQEVPAPRGAAPHIYIYTYSHIYIYT